MRYRHFMQLAVLLGVSSIGCVVSTSEPEPEVTKEPTKATVTRTVVQLMPDGNHAVNVLTIPADKAAAQHARRLARKNQSKPRSAPFSAPDGLGRVEQAIGQNDCDDGNDVWVYNETSCPASPYAQICFWGTGTTSLNNYRFFGDTGPYWGGNVGSFWPGQYNGALYLNSAPWLYQQWDVWDPCTNADDNGDDADVICTDCW